MLEHYWADLLDPKDPIVKDRQRAWDRFQIIGLPRPRQEPFQYLAKKPVFPRPARRCTKEVESRSGLVFVDGFFEEQASQVPHSLVCMPLETAFRSYGLFLQNRSGKILAQETDPFAALNGAFQGRGVFLYVPPKCKTALHLTQVYFSDQMATPRLHIYLGRDSQLDLIQHSQGASGLSNGFVDVVLDSGAQASFIDEGSGDFQAIRATLKRESRLKVVLLGNKLRHSIRVELAEENGEALLYGIGRLDEQAESHFHVTVEHQAPSTRSKQHFKSVLRGQSRFSFEGKIHVHPSAQKTEAYQLNNNLILSDEACANAKPNLEILADDVKASHGSTVGQLNEEELFYLRSRGLGLKQAQEWLVEGFCKEILDHAR